MTLTQQTCNVQLGNVLAKIQGAQLPTEFWESLSDRMSYEVPGAFFSPQYTKGHWDGRKRLLNKRYLTFPTGLFSLFRESCKSYGISYKVEDTRIKPAHGLPLNMHGITLYDYQDQTASEALAKQRGMIRVATGGGKTEIIAELIRRTNIPTLVLIHKQDIFWQLVERLEKRLQIPIGRIGCGEINLQRINVGMIQTIHRAFGGNLRGMKVEADKTKISKPEVIRYVIDQTQCVMIDECHHISSSIFSAALTKCTNAFYRWGFSASPWREDNADLVLDAHTGPRCVDISASELIRRGYLSRPTIYLFVFNHGRPKVNNYPGTYENYVVRNVFRNKYIVRSAMKAASRGKTTLIAVTRIEHGETLEIMLQQVMPGKVKFTSGKVDSKDRKQVLKDLDARKLNVVIATTVFGEGVDCPSLDVLINAKANQSSIDSYQLVGRTLRKTKTKDKVTVIDIYDDHCKYLGKHSKDRLKIYKTEPEFIIKKVTSLDHISFG